jgi:hypothetical protein
MKKPRRRPRNIVINVTLTPFINVTCPEPNATEKATQEAVSAALLKVLNQSPSLS